MRIEERVSKRLGVGVDDVLGCSPVDEFGDTRVTLAWGRVMKVRVGKAEVAAPASKPTEHPTAPTFGGRAVDVGDVEMTVDYASWTVAMLRAECKARELPVSGTKAELITRLGG